MRNDAPMIPRKRKAFLDARQVRCQYLYESARRNEISMGSRREGDGPITPPSARRIVLSGMAYEFLAMLDDLMVLATHCKDEPWIEFGTRTSRFYGSAFKVINNTLLLTIGQTASFQGIPGSTSTIMLTIPPAYRISMPSAGSSTSSWKLS